MRLIVRISLATLVALAPATAWAATATNSFKVNANVTSYCSVSATDMTFAAYSGAQLDATTSLQAQCTNGTPYNIGLDAGAATGATVALRKMAQGGSTLNYTLYSDPGRTVVWGNTVGTDTVSGTGTGAAVTKTIYGRIPKDQFSTGGTYQDTVNITLTY